MAFVLIPKSLEVLCETLIKIQLTFVKKRKTAALPDSGPLPMYQPHGQGEPSTQTKAKTPKVSLTCVELTVP